MKKLVVVALLGTSMVAALPTQARNTKHLMPIAEGIATKDAEERLDGKVKFYFGNQSHPKVLQNFGSNFTNKHRAIFLTTGWGS